MRAPTDAITKWNYHCAKPHEICVRSLNAGKNLDGKAILLLTMGLHAISHNIPWSYGHCFPRLLVLFHGRLELLPLLPHLLRKVRHGSASGFGPGSLL